MGDGPQTLVWTNIRGLVYIIWEDWKGNTWDFPIAQEVQKFLNLF